jgi:small subunit ribosomal protein S16
MVREPQEKGRGTTGFEEKAVAVRIRMKRMGRKHRSFFRICAVDSRNPRDGRVLEELGTYDPMVHETDARALLKGDRISYWLGVGALPSDKVKVLIKKYGPGGTHVEAQAQARERLSLPRAIPDPGEPAYIPAEPGDEPVAAAPAAEAPAEAAEPAAEATE